MSKVHGRSEGEVQAYLVKQHAGVVGELVIDVEELSELEYRGIRCDIPRRNSRRDLVQRFLGGYFPVAYHPVATAKVGRTCLPAHCSSIVGGIVCEAFSVAQLVAGDILYLLSIQVLCAAGSIVIRVIDRNRPGSVAAIPGQGPAPLRGVRVIVPFDLDIGVGAVLVELDTAGEVLSGIPGCNGVPDSLFLAGNGLWVDTDLDMPAVVASYRTVTPVPAGICVL